MAHSFPDATGEVYRWLSDALTEPVWLSMPEGPRSFPGVLITRVGGRPQFGGDNARFQFDCFGDETPASRQQANALAYRVAALVDQVSGRPIAGGSVEAMVERLDPAAPYCRVLVDAFLFVRSANAS